MTNADLITEAKRFPRIGLVGELADALETAEAQVARLTAIAKAAITHLSGTTISGDLRRALVHREYPADLLAAVQHLAEWAHRDHQEPMPCTACATGFAVLTRCGLIEEEAR